MLINCLTCCKTISTKRDTCPYCRADISHLSFVLSEERKKGTVAKRFSGTILSLVHREKMGV